MAGADAVVSVVSPAEGCIVAVEDGRVRVMIRPLAPANQRGHSGRMSVATAWGRAAYPPKSLGSGTYIGAGTILPSSGTPLPTRPDVSGAGSGTLLPGGDTSGGGKTGAVGKGLPETVGGGGGKAGNG